MFSSFALFLPYSKQYIHPSPHNPRKSEVGTERLSPTEIEILPPRLVIIPSDVDLILFLDRVSSRSSEPNTEPNIPTSYMS